MTGRRLDTEASFTAQFNAAQRAAESMLSPDRRMLDDVTSGIFVTHPALRIVLSHPLIARTALAAFDRKWPGLHSHIILRARYVDEARRTASEQGVDQLVLLGAGFDGTSLRSAPLPLTIFEVDAPATQEAKRALLQRRQARSPHRIRWVACDFERDDFGERLVDAGFDVTRPCLVIWMGVTFYLSDSAFDATLRRLAARCAIGSRLVLDYGDPEIVDGTSRWAGARRASRTVAHRGEPYRLGFTPTELESVLTRNGFNVVETLRLPDLARRFSSPNPPWSHTDDWLGIATAELALRPR